MPRLVMFCPCEKVIVSEDDHTTSLITILEQVSIALPPDKPLTDESLAPIKWSVFTLWQKEPDDNGIQYEQRVQLYAPNDILSTEGFVKFQMTTNRHRNVVNIMGFPIGIAGDSVLKLSIRIGEEEDWTTVAEYIIPVIHSKSAD